MLKIDQNFVARLRVPKGYPTPKPFPGKQPVRVELVWLENGKPRVYVGKPNSAIVIRVMLGGFNVQCFREFDRKQIIASLGALDHKKLEYPFLWHKRLFQTYHPALETSPMDSFIAKSFWIQSFFGPYKMPAYKHTFYLAPHQKSMVATAALKVEGFLKGEQGEQIARRIAAAREARTKSKFRYMEPPF